MTCGSSERMAGLGSSTSCNTGNGNATVTDVETLLGGDWTERGSVENAPGTNGLLTIALTSGSFGSGDAAGTWSIAASFWTLYADAAISLHVGNGGGDPDHWIWEITDGETSGTWSYDLISGGGGGLSNLKLYSRGTATVRMPEPGSVALLGLALVALAGRRRPSA